MSIQPPLYPPEQHEVVGPDAQGAPTGKITRPWLAFLTNLVSAVKAAIPGGPNTAIQVNDNGSFYGDKNLTWDKTTHQQAVKGDGANTSVVVDSLTTKVIGIGQDGAHGALTIGSQVIAGVEIAEDTEQAYVARFGGGVALGLSTGETPGSPTVYTQWQEVDVLADRSAMVIGDNTAGAIPGKAVGAAWNAAGAGAASTLFGQLKDGRFFVIWMDTTGAMRYNVGATLASIRPTEDNSVSDTSGSLFGSGGTSWIPLALGSEPLTFVSDGAGRPILVPFAA